MKMNRSFSLVRTLLLLGAALCGSTGLASAQSLVKGEFTLPLEVRWGQAVLPAGHYSFDLQDLVTTQVMRVRGEGTNMMVIAQGQSDLPSSTTDSALVLAQNGDTTVVRQLRLAPLGITLHYAAHKGAPQSVAMANGSTQPVPVRVSGR